MQCCPAVNYQQWHLRTIRAFRKNMFLQCTVKPIATQILKEKSTNFLTAEKLFHWYKPWHYCALEENTAICNGVYLKHSAQHFREPISTHSSKGTLSWNASEILNCWLYCFLLMSKTLTATWKRTRFQSTTSDTSSTVGSVCSYKWYISLAIINTLRISLCWQCSSTV